MPATTPRRVARISLGDWIRGGWRGGDPFYCRAGASPAMVIRRQAVRMAYKRFWVGIFLPRIARIARIGFGKEAVARRRSFYCRAGASPAMVIRRQAMRLPYKRFWVGIF